jgi:hypothetical protein
MTSRGPRLERQFYILESELDELANRRAEADAPRLGDRDNLGKGVFVENADDLTFASSGRRTLQSGRESARPRACDDLLSHTQG